MFVRRYKGCAGLDDIDRREHPAIMHHCYTASIYMREMASGSRQGLATRCASGQVNQEGR